MSKLVHNTLETMFDSKILPLINVRKLSTRNITIKWNHDARMDQCADH